MFCPIRSDAANKVPCDKECAWFNGCVDGAEPQCAVFTIAAAIESSRVLLTDVSSDLTEISGGVNSLAGRG